MGSQLIKDNIQKIANLEGEMLAKRTWDDRLIDAVSGFFGSKAFAYLNAAFFTGWIVCNRGQSATDPYPYQFLTLVVSLEAIFLSIFLLISQNRQSLLTERRSHMDLQVNLLNEQETTVQLILLSRIAQRLGISIDTLPEEMSCKTDVADMGERLDTILADQGKNPPEDKQPKS